MIPEIKPTWQLFDWDSQFSGFTIAGACPVASPHGCREMRPPRWACLYFLTDAADIDTIRALEHKDFALADIR